MEVFGKFNAIPFSKMLTFFRKETFVLTASYGSNETGIMPSSAEIGKRTSDDSVC